MREASTSGIDATGFADALKKLKKGKNSPDGLTAELLQVHGSIGTENCWRKLSSKISTYGGPEHHEKDLWIHVPRIAPSAGLQVDTDGLRQRLPREHWRTHVLENWRAVQRMEPGVQRCAVGRSESIRSRLSRCCTTSDGRDGSGSSLASSDGEGMVSEQGTSKTGHLDLGAGEPGEETPARSPREPDHLRHDSGMCGQALRREVGSERRDG